MNLEQDYQDVVSRVAPGWTELKNQNILLTGGTGFFGKWIIETFLTANREHSLDANLCVVSRSPEEFLTKNPRYKAQQNLQWIKGDVRVFEFPKQHFSHVIHAAVDASSNSFSTIDTLDVCYNGTRRISDFCHYSGVKKLLFVSSGAIYGRQPPRVSHITENHLPLDSSGTNPNAYTVGKRLAEWLVLEDPKLREVQVKLARCFAFAGPHLSLDAPFALTDFIKKLLRNQSLIIQGDGTDLRSYMYAADLAVWLWQILFHGERNQAYNVGSDEAVSVAELAEKLNLIAGTDAKIVVKKTLSAGQAPNRYVPSIEKAKKQLNLKVKFSLDETLSRTWTHFQSEQQSDRGLKI